MASEAPVEPNRELTGDIQVSTHSESVPDRSPDSPSTPVTQDEPDEDGIEVVDACSIFRVSPHISVPFLLQCADFETDLTFKRFLHHWRASGIPFALTLPVLEGSSISVFAPAPQVLRYLMRQLLLPQTPNAYVYIIYAVYSTWYAQAGSLGSDALKMTSLRATVPSISSWGFLVAGPFTQKCPRAFERTPSPIPLPSSIWPAWANLIQTFRKLAEAAVIAYVKERVVHAAVTLLSSSAALQSGSDPASTHSSLDMTLNLWSGGTTDVSPKLGPMHSRALKGRVSDSSPTKPNDFVLNDDTLYDRLPNDGAELSSQEQLVQTFHIECGRALWLASKLGMNLQPASLVDIATVPLEPTNLTHSPQLRSRNDDAQLRVALESFPFRYSNLDEFAFPLGKKDQVVSDVISCISHLSRAFAFVPSFGDCSRPLLGRPDDVEFLTGMDPLTSSPGVLANCTGSLLAWTQVQYHKSLQVRYATQYEDLKRIDALRKILETRQLQLPQRLPDISETLEPTFHSVEDLPIRVALSKVDIEYLAGPVVRAPFRAWKSSTSVWLDSEFSQLVQQLVHLISLHPTLDPQIAESLLDTLGFQDIPLPGVLLATAADFLDMRANFSSATNRYARLSALRSMLGMLKVHELGAVPPNAPSDSDHNPTSLEPLDVPFHAGALLGLQVAAMCTTESVRVAIQTKAEEVALFRALASAFRIAALANDPSPRNTRLNELHVRINRSERAISSLEKGIDPRNSKLKLTELAASYAQSCVELPLQSKYSGGLIQRFILSMIKARFPTRKDEIHLPNIPLGALPQPPHWLSTAVQADIGPRLKSILALYDSQWEELTFSRHHPRSRAAAQRSPQAPSLTLSQLAALLRLDLTDVGATNSPSSKANHDSARALAAVIASSAEHGNLPALAPSILRPTISIPAVARRQEALVSGASMTHTMSSFMTAFSGSSDPPTSHGLKQEPLEALSDYVQTCVAAFGAGTTVENVSATDPFSLYDISSALDMASLQDAIRDHCLAVSAAFADTTSAINDALQDGLPLLRVDALALDAWLTSVHGSWKSNRTHESPSDTTETEQTSAESTRDGALQNSETLIVDRLIASAQPIAQESQLTPLELRYDNWIERVDQILRSSKTALATPPSDQSLRPPLRSGYSSSMLMENADVSAYPSSDPTFKNPYLPPLLVPAGLRTLNPSDRRWHGVSDEHASENNSKLPSSLEVERYMKTLDDLSETEQHLLQQTGKDIINAIHTESVGAIGVLPRVLTSVVPLATLLTIRERCPVLKRPGQLWPTPLMLSLSQSKTSKRDVWRSTLGLEPISVQPKVQSIAGPLYLPKRWPGQTKRLIEGEAQKYAKHTELVLGGTAQQSTVQPSSEPPTESVEGNVPTVRDAGEPKTREQGNLAKVELARDHGESKADEEIRDAMSETHGRRQSLLSLHHSISASFLEPTLEESNHSPLNAQQHTSGARTAADAEAAFEAHREERRARARANAAAIREMTVPMLSRPRATSPARPDATVSRPARALNASTTAYTTSRTSVGRSRASLNAAPTLSDTSTPASRQEPQQPIQPQVLDPLALHMQELESLIKLSSQPSQSRSMKREYHRKTETSSGANRAEVTSVSLEPSPLLQQRRRGRSPKSEQQVTDTLHPSQKRVRRTTASMYSSLTGSTASTSPIAELSNETILALSEALSKTASALEVGQALPSELAELQAQLAEEVARSVNESDSQSIHKGEEI